MGSSARLRRALYIYSQTNDLDHRSNRSIRKDSRTRELFECQSAAEQLRNPFTDVRTRPDAAHPAIRFAHATVVSFITNPFPSDNPA
jgi:hypothetical protein